MVAFRHQSKAACTAVAVSVFALSQPVLAQEAAPAAVAEQSGTVRSITIRGAERLEPETVRSYVGLSAGDSYDRNRLDRALKDLYATELFADVTIRDRQGELVVDVRENPVVNRIVLEGNKRVKDEKFKDEIKLAPRQIFTRSKARADVARILELYRRQGRFAAAVEPKIVQLDQNRVDVVFEIDEGPKSKVRRINIVGNTKFSDGDLRGEMATKEAKWYKFFTSNDTYDPDRSAYDQQKLRQYYLTQGYADFRVVSSVAELTPDRKDFIITYVVEEGERYKFGEVDLESQIRDIKEENFKRMLPMKQGDWYNAKEIEDTVTSLSESVGLLGYAFADINPRFNRDKEKREMGVTFVINETPRVYVERVEINGNTITKDHVIRREFRLAEGDAFNSFRVKRSRDRIQSLGYFQENLEIQQKQGSGPDRIVLAMDLQEKPTGELQLSAGYSSLESFLISAGITQRNFRGIGQELRASASLSGYARSIELGFTEPYLFDRNLALSVDLFRRDYGASSSLGSTVNTTYDQVTTGFQIRAGFPITEFWSASIRYGLTYDEVWIDEDIYYTDGACDPTLAGRYLCEALGNRITSSLGYTIAYDTRDNAIRPSRGLRASFSQDFAGLGGDVRYIRTRAEATKYWNLGSGFILSAHAEGGYINGLGQDVLLTNRFFLGEPTMRGFDIRGIGPRVVRTPYDTSTTPATLLTDKDSRVDDALGGNAYYLGRLELDIPLGSGAAEMGLRPSVFMDVGAVFGTRKPTLTDACAASNAAGTACPSAAIRQYTNSSGEPLYLDDDGNITTDNTGTVYGYTPSVYSEAFYGNTPRPRLSLGVGVNWNSPFGPLRIDFAKTLLKAQGDNTKAFSFNVGTQF